MIKYLLSKITSKKQTKREKKPLMRKELEEKAVHSAKKAVHEYRRVFDRLSEYDRT